MSRLILSGNVTWALRIVSRIKQAHSKRTIHTHDSTSLKSLRAASAQHQISPIFSFWTSWYMLSCFQPTATPTEHNQSIMHSIDCDAQMTLSDITSNCQSQQSRQYHCNVNKVIFIVDKEMNGLYEFWFSAHISHPHHISVHLGHWSSSSQGVAHTWTGIAVSMSWILTDCLVRNEFNNKNKNGKHAYIQIQMVTHLIMCQWVSVTFFKMQLFVISREEWPQRDNECFISAVNPVMTQGRATKRIYSRSKYFNTISHILPYTSEARNKTTVKTSSINSWAATDCVSVLLQLQ